MCNIYLSEHDVVLCNTDTAFRNSVRYGSCYARVSVGTLLMQGTCVGVAADTCALHKAESIAIRKYRYLRTRRTKRTRNVKFSLAAVFKKFFPGKL